ncbi:MAG: hypothetical protein KBA03_03675 [Anaerolineaceae bacterium]|nr:hypothetical protein [Anaerolineaceae bacterium]
MKAPQDYTMTCANCDNKTTVSIGADEPESVANEIFAARGWATYDNKDYCPKCWDKKVEELVRDFTESISKVEKAFSEIKTWIVPALESLAEIIKEWAPELQEENDEA